MSYTKDNFLKNLSEFEIKGFDRFDDDYSFISRRKDRENRIVISTNKFFPNSYSFEGVIASIRFEKVEVIMEELMGKHVNNFVKGSHTIHFVYNFNNPFTSITNRRVSDEESFYLAKKELHSIVSKSIFTFFEENENIDMVWNKLELMAMSEMIDYVSQPLPLRRMIIKKLTKDPAYEDYAKTMVDYFTKDKSFQLDYKVLIEELYSKLKNYQIDIPR